MKKAFLVILASLFILLCLTVFGNVGEHEEAQPEEKPVTTNNTEKSSTDFASSQQQTSVDTRTQPIANKEPKKPKLEDPKTLFDHLRSSDWSKVPQSLDEVEITPGIQKAFADNQTTYALIDYNLGFLYRLHECLNEKGAIPEKATVNVPLYFVVNEYGEAIGESIDTNPKDFQYEGISGDKLVNFSFCLEQSHVGHLLDYSQNERVITAAKKSPEKQTRLVVHSGVKIPFEENYEYQLIQNGEPPVYDQ